MEKEFIPYELAVKLKALGFDEPCMASWSYTYELQQHIEFKLGYIIDGPRNYTNAPLFQQAFRWLDKKFPRYTALIDDKARYKRFSWSILDGGDIKYGYEALRSDDRREVEEDCLKKLIEIVESENK